MLIVSGLIPERDFEPGKSVLQNIEEGINNSDKILLVVSKNTPEKFYQDLERTQVLTCLHLFNEQHKDTFIIDLGVDDLPDPLRPFSDQVINCSRTPMTLNEVREVLAAPQLPIFEQRPRGTKLPILISVCSFILLTHTPVTVISIRYSFVIN